MIETEKCVATDVAGARAQALGSAVRKSGDRSHSVAGHRSRSDLADQKILAGYNLVIDGRQLRGATTRVLFDGEEEIIPADDKTSASRIIVPLPADLQPGLHSVQVTHPVDFGPTLPHDTRRGVESNVAPFVLAPQIDHADAEHTPHNSTLSFDITPAVGRTQRAALLIGGNTISIPRDSVGDPSRLHAGFPHPLTLRPAGLICFASRSTVRRVRSKSTAREYSLVQRSTSHECDRRKIGARPISER